jgi:putative ABC transport system permease protein
MSIGASAQALILDQVKNVGSNLVFIIPGGSGSSRFSSPAAAQGIVIKTLIERDAQALAAEPTIEAVAPVVRGQARIIYENNDTTVTWQGSTAEYFAISKLDIARGFAFTESDLQSYNRVIVIGSALAETLFGQKDPVGKMVRMKDMSFRVIGVLAPKGVGAFGVDQDSTVIVPLTVGQKQLLGIDYYNSITVQAKDAYNIEFTKSRITSVLRANHRVTDPDKDDFMIRTQEDALSILGNITSILTVFLTAIASISLIVGGIGIMNIMLVSVVERTREIGLRKAVGATNNDILQQFLWEAIILTFTGGMIGIAAGAGLTGIAYLVLSQTLATGWGFILPASSIILAVAVSTFTGVVFGIYPARQAGKKDPIEALRYE